MSEPIPVTSVAASESPDTGERVMLPMTAHDRRRVRRIVEAPDGMRFALELPTGSVLQPGAVLHRSGSRAYVVAPALEEVIVARPCDIAEAARVGHLIGNLHRDIDVSGDEIVALADVALADRLRRAGVPTFADRRPFHGRAPSEHAH